VITRSLDPTDIELANTTHVQVHQNGQHVRSIAWEDVPRMISEARRGIYKLRLENRKPHATAGAEYELQLAVADEIELDAVDALFKQHLAVDLPTSAGIRLFKEESERLGTTGRYVDGLVDFVLGVLAKKERADPVSTRDDALRRFKRALAELAEHDARPVPRAVSAVCRFNLNDVRQTRPRTGDPLMDGCVELLRSIATGGDWRSIRAPGVAVAKNPLCPIDADTHRILSAFGALFGTEPDERELASIERLAVTAEMLPPDRVKLLVILAAALLRRGRFDEPARFLRDLQHDPIFGDWAAAVSVAGVTR
jgi:hypothetical protein